MISTPTILDIPLPPSPALLGDSSNSVQADLTSSGQAYSPVGTSRSHVKAVQKVNPAQQIDHFCQINLADSLIPSTMHHMENMGGGSKPRLFEVPVTLITPNCSLSLNKELLSSSSFDFALESCHLVSPPNFPAALSSFNKGQLDHVGIDQDSNLGYSCPDTSSPLFVSFKVPKQPVGNSPPFGSPSHVTSPPFCFTTTSKVNSSSSSRRKKKSHNFPLSKLGPLSISPSKSLLLGRLANSNKRKNIFSGSYAFSGKQRKEGGRNC